MRIGELARQAGVTTKTVRYYESVGLLDAQRLSNGYRDYNDRDVRIVQEVRTLKSLGIPAEQSRPFLDCLVAGHGRGDDCPDSVATYRAAIDEFDDRIADLTARREAIAALLASANTREPLCQLHN
jgi:DNA-binding transcriptional MerR regulator